jgi:hypothetical protein
MPKGREEEYYDWPVHDARGRTETPVKSYEAGGTIFEKNEAERKRIAEANKKAAAEGKSKRDDRKADRQKKRDDRKADRQKRRDDRKKGKSKETEVKVTSQEKRNKKKIEKLKDRDVKVTTTAKTEEDKKKLVYSGKLKDKKNIKEVTVTEGGAYPAYKKDTKQAISFKEAFASARKEQGPGGVFTWNGRKYTTDRADDKKPKVDTKPKTDKKPKVDTKPKTDKKPKVDTKPKTDKKPRVEPPEDTEFIPGLDEGDTEVNKAGYLIKRKRKGS